MLNEFKDESNKVMEENTPATEIIQPLKTGAEETTQGIPAFQVAEEPEQPVLKYYEIIYGVLFDPVKTMQRVVNNPPLGSTLVIMILLALAGLLTSLYTSAHGGPSNLGLEMGLPLKQAKMFSEALRVAAPVLAILGSLFYFIKWFFYSALLHLLADFFGGRGRARTVFVVYGLAGLPEVFLIPLNVLTTLLIPSLAAVVSTIGSLGVLIWGIILLTIGLREAHQFSTGRALAVIFTPVVAVGVLILVSMIGLMSAMAAFMPTSW